jgi:hypothetical protein
MTRGRSLLSDTLWRRTRAAAAGAVHGVDDFIARALSAHVRILFEAASPMSLVTFRPVFERLRSDPRIELWFTTSDRSWDADRIYHAVGVKEKVVNAADVRWKKFDVYVNTDFWNMTWLPRRVRRVHLFHGVAGKYGLDAPVRIAPIVATFDRLLFPNRDRLERYAEAGLVDRDGPEAVLAGYPKVDCLVDGSLDRSAIQESLGLDATRPTVLYAPTWSPYSSLNAVGVDVIRALGRLDVNVVVKIHDRSYDRTERGSGGVDWRARLEPVCRSVGAHLARNADASPYLFVADAIVTDHSSVGFEFMLLDRPIVTIDCPQLVEKARINPDKVSLLRSAARVAATAEEVVRAVEEELGAPARLSDRRRAIASELFYRAGSATGRAVQSIYDVLSLPAMTPVAVTRSSHHPERTSAHA